MANAAHTIGEILTAQARERPDAIALLDARGGHERRLTFAQLEREVAVAAAWLAGEGVQCGHAVLVFVPMSAELYIALLALFRLGAVALFLDPSAGRAHIEQCCARRPPDALLAIPKAHALRLLSPALRRIPRQIVVGGWLPATRRWLAGPAPQPMAAATLTGDEPALITFTSGSTGVPKAAVRTHAFLVAQHRALAPSIGLAAGQVDFATLPVFTLANLASGVTTVIGDVDLQRPGAVDAAKVFAAVARFGVTRITASPAFFERLAVHGQATGTTLPALRELHTGGAPVFPRLLENLQQLAPHARVVAVYGSTEAEPIAHVARDEVAPEDFAAMRAGRGLLAGAPVAEIKLRVLHDRWGTPRGAIARAELERETMGVDAPGEIVVTGAHVLRGYLGGIGDEETKFSVDGEIWHRTGDAGLIDSRGRVWLLGRCAARIDDARGRLYPFTVECVAMTFPEVRRAAALGHGGRRLLLIEGSEALRPALQTATTWANLDEVRCISALPVDRRHNAKIDYAALRRLLADK